jgi:outer membrane protein W
MILTADTRTKKIVLQGVPAEANAKIIIQDTSRGGTTDVNVRANSDGVATGQFGFDFNKSVHVVVNDKVYRLTFDADQPIDGTLRLSDGTPAPTKIEPVTSVFDLSRRWIEAESETTTTVVGE